MKYLNKYSQVSIIVLTIVLLVVPRPSLAFIGTGIFDFFNTALEGIEEISGPVIQKIIQVFFLYVVGLIALSVSTGLLEMASDPSHLSLNGNSMVQAGWHFTAGIANMLIILILIAIAFALILKMGSFQVKKILPRLIMVALLINFSLFFIGMLVDISNIIFNTLLSGNTGIISQVADTLKTSGLDTWKNLGAWFVALGIAFAIPFVGPFAQLGALTTIVLFTGPNFIAWTFQIVCFFLVSIMFLTYAVLFLARIFIIQLLAIISPLAFLALILPQTKKHWDKWLHLLVEWVFLGVFLFFFLILGLKTVHHLLPESGAIPAPLLGWGGLTEYFIYYFFLTLYLAVALILGKKMMPSFAQAIINQAMGLAKMAWGGAILPAGARMRSFLGRKAAPNVEKFGKSLIERAGIAPSAERSAFTRGFANVARFGTRWAGRGLATGAGQLVIARKAQDEAEFAAAKKEAANKDSEDNFRKISRELVKGKLANWNTISGLLGGTVANSDSDDIQKALRNGTLSGETLGRALLEAQRSGPPAYRPLAKALYGRLLDDPEQFGNEFKVDRKADGSIRRDEEGTPAFTSFRIQKIVKEIPEKLTSADITAKILGDTIDKGRTDGEEYEKGGEKVLQQLREIRGNDLTGALVKAPQTRKGREEILDNFRRADPEKLHEQGASGIFTYLNSSAAQGLGITSPLSPRQTNELLDLFRERDRARAGGGDLGRDKANKLRDLIDLWTVKEPSAEMEKLEKQISNLEKEMAKPYRQGQMVPTRRAVEDLRRGQKENLEEMNARLANLQKAAETARKEAEMAEKKAELPTIKPAPSEKEIKTFKDIASAAKPIPEKGRMESLESNLRKIRGAIRESFDLQGKLKEEIKEVEQLMNEVAARGEETSALDVRKTKLQDGLEAAVGREAELKNRASSTQEKLARKTEKKARKKQKGAKP